MILHKWLLTIKGSDFSKIIITSRKERKSAVAKADYFLFKVANLPYHSGYSLRYKGTVNM